MTNKPVQHCPATAAHDDFLRDFRAALQSDPPAIPCKHLYDARGSALFEAICKSPDYYLTRADLSLHEAHAAEMAAAIGPNAHLIELGSGSGIKTERLLAALESPRAYTAIEISAKALEQSVARLKSRFPALEIHPLQTDYTQPIPDHAFALEPPARRRALYFPGSTIGNFGHSEARAFLGRIARMAGDDGLALIGVDRIKPREVLERAYDDRDGVTAEFNRNLLARAQRELGADLELDAWRHRAVYNQSRSRVELYLEAVRPTSIRLGGLVRRFAAGERIHTENSHKYTEAGFAALLKGTGLRIVRHWTDPEQRIFMFLLGSGS